MKHLFTTAILAAACALSATAQSVVITDKEGLQHTFAADRIQDIKFVNMTTPDPGTVEFSTVDASGYTGGTASMTFRGEAQSLTLWVYGPSDALYLRDGVYEVNASTEAMSIDSNPNYSYLTENKTSQGLKSGTMTVATSGAEYNITFDMILADDTPFKASYVGEIPLYSRYVVLPDAAQAKVQEVNDQVPGEYYIKFNDLNYKYEMAIDFFADPETTQLPAGEYVYSENKTAGTFGPASYVDIYAPYTSNRLAEGSKINVSYEGDECIIGMDLLLVDGRSVTVNYRGVIEWPVPQEPEIVFTTATAPYSWSTGLTLSLSDGTNRLIMDVYSEYGKKLLAGTYTLTSTKAQYTIDSNTSRTYLNESGNGFKGGTMTVSIDGEEISLIIDFVKADDTPFKAKYTGKIPGALIDNSIKKELSAVRYSSFNNQEPGQFLLKGNDTDWSIEMSLYLNANASDTTLPAGTYTYDGTDNPMTIGSSTSIDLYNPYSSNGVAEGSTVTISYNGDIADIVMDLNLEDGRKINITFNGTIAEE